MTRSTLAVYPPKSVRAHIRRRKARIRREVIDPKVQREEIQKLLAKFHLVARGKE